MQYVPHDYQAYAIDRLVHERCCALFLEPGLGKTVITLSAISTLMFDTFEVKKVLVIAPLRVADHTWSSECEKWEHLQHFRLSKVLGSVMERTQALQRPAHLYLINRENVEWLITHHPWDFDMVVIDELSSFKSASAKRFTSLKKMRPRIKRMVGLTGTPAPNSLMDLWSQLFLLDGGQRLGRFMGTYRRTYFEPDKRNQHIVFSYKPKPDAEQAIYDKISDICVSMKACDYLNMPERIDNQVEVVLHALEMEMYRKMEREMLLPFEEGDIDAVNAAALTNKLLQMANGAVYDENQTVRMMHSKKLDALADLIEASNGKPVLLFYSYLHDKTRIKQRFTVSELHTVADIEAWNRGEIGIAVTHPASAGHGLNLQAGGSTIIWFGLPWSLEYYQQANARLWRQGQQETVVIHHLIAKGTVDEEVMRALERKETTQTALIQAVKARIGG